MFGIYFGKYLQDKGVITEAQQKEMLEEVKSSRLRMGLLAIVNGMMTEAQAEEVNQMQQIYDRRFGDLALVSGVLEGAEAAAEVAPSGFWSPVWPV